MLRLGGAEQLVVSVVGLVTLPPALLRFSSPSPFPPLLGVAVNDSRRLGA